MPELPSQPLRLRVLWAGLAIGLVLASALCWSLASQHFVAGSAAGGWAYPYVRALTWEPVLAGLAALAAAALLLWVPVRTTGAALALVGASIVAATLAHAGIRSSAPYDLETIFRSPGANAFHTFAQEVGPSELLARFERARRQAPLHAQSNMPGKTLLVHALERVTTDTAVLPWLLVLLSNLGGLLVFALARELSGSARVGLYAAVLYLFTPGRLYFFPIMNTLTPLLVLAFLWVIVRWLRSHSTATAAFGGVLLFALVLFEPLPLVVGLLVIALAAAAILRGELTVGTFVIQSAAMGAFFALTAVLVYEATGFHLLNAFRRIGEHAVEFNETAGRPYSVWVLANLGEFALSAGPATLVLAAALPLASTTYAGPLRAWYSRPEVAVSLGVFAVLVVTNLLGINRGEVVRLWIFLACLVQIPAAWACAALENRGAILAVLTAAILQAAIGIATIGFVVP